MPADPLEQSAWDRGKARVAVASREHPAFPFAWTVVPAALTGIFAPTDALLRVVLALVMAAVGYCLVPAAWAAGVALRDWLHRPNELREMVRELRATVEAQEKRHSRELEVERAKTRAAELETKIAKAMQLPPHIEKQLERWESIDADPRDIPREMARSDFGRMLRRFLEPLTAALGEGGQAELAETLKFDAAKATTSATAREAWTSIQQRLNTRPSVSPQPSFRAERRIPAGGHGVGTPDPHAECRLRRTVDDRFYWVKLAGPPVGRENAPAFGTVLYTSDLYDERGNALASARRAGHEHISDDSAAPIEPEPAG